MLPFDPDRVEKLARDATTQDLLDRVTAYREGMEPEALEIFEAELHRRGVRWQEHLRRDDVLLDASGVSLRCSFCDMPAVERRWGWHRLWGKVPVFPRYFRYCSAHGPDARPAAQ